MNCIALKSYLVIEIDLLTIKKQVAINFTKSFFFLIVRTSTSMFRTQSIPFPLEARQNLIGGKDLLTLAELKIDDPRIMDKPNDYEMSVSFSVGTETISAPMAIFKGEE